MMKKWKVLLEISEGNYCDVFVPAETKAKAIKFCEGNGEVVKIQDVSKEITISLDYVSQALNNFGFGQAEKDLILRTLSSCNIAE